MLLQKGTKVETVAAEEAIREAVAVAMTEEAAEEEDGAGVVTKTEAAVVVAVEDSLGLVIGTAPTATMSALQDAIAVIGVELPRAGQEATLAVEVAMVVAATVVGMVQEVVLVEPVAVGRLALVTGHAPTAATTASHGEIPATGAAQLKLAAVVVVAVKEVAMVVEAVVAMAVAVARGVIVVVVLDGITEIGTQTEVVVVVVVMMIGGVVVAEVGIMTDMVVLLTGIGTKVD